MKLTVPSKLPFYLLAVQVVVLIAATIVEHLWGSTAAYAHIYGSVLFRLLWAGIVLTGTWVIVRRRLWYRLHALVLHASFVVILLGALCTAFGAVNGNLHLRVGKSSRLFLTDDKDVGRLPFDVKLTQFTVHHYPGTDTPADYESRLRVAGRDYVVSMNRIAEIDGWRIYQTSYDTDGKGSVLSLYHDPWGILLTYVGYGLLFVSLLWSLLARGGAFRTLLRHPALRCTAFVLLLAAGWGSIGASASDFSDGKLRTIARSKADSIGRRQIVYNGRVCPLNTLAVDFCKKISGKTSFRGLTAEQILLSWVYYPDEWQNVAMVRIKNSTLRERLGIVGDYASVAQLYAGGEYRLQRLMAAERDPSSPLARAIQDTDEKVGLIVMLYKGTLIRPLPADAKAAQLSEARVTAEIVYNRIPAVKIAFMYCLTLGFLAFGVQVSGRRRSWLDGVFQCAVVAAFVCLTLWFAFRWYLAGFVPMSNGFETMLLLAVCVLGVASLLMRRFPFVVPFGLLIAGFALLVAHLSDMNPQITPLMPVLSSPLLSLHVTIMMFSYALFALACLNSGYALWLSRRESNAARVEQLTVLNRLLLHPAVFLLSAGIFIGAIWANVSWGRYWGWDPKEVWALITMLIYSFALHPGLLPALRRPRPFHWFVLLAFLSVLFTYFGVNFLLGGLHSYA